jgi:methylphosphotriester-DNA--protein-cysteine methyltransferase
MPRMDARASHFRPSWLEDVVAHCQRFVGTAMRPPDDGVISIASNFLATLPDAATPAEDLALRALLFDVAARWGTRLHADAHRLSSKRCEFVDTQLLGLFANDARCRAKSTFLSWAREFDGELVRHHSRSPAQRAAAIVRAPGGEHATVAGLADRLDVPDRQLRRMFHQCFGLSLAEYIRQARLQRALELMLEVPGKVEPVALQVGYKSKKNFYRVFKLSIGMTPSAFLRLPHDRARDVLETARLKTQM